MIGWLDVVSVSFARVRLGVLKDGGTPWQSHPHGLIQPGRLDSLVQPSAGAVTCLFRCKQVLGAMMNHGQTTSLATTRQQHQVCRRVWGPTQGPPPSCWGLLLPFQELLQPMPTRHASSRQRLPGRAEGLAVADGSRRAARQPGRPLQLPCGQSRHNLRNALCGATVLRSSQCVLLHVCRLIRSLPTPQVEEYEERLGASCSRVSALESRATAVEKVGSHAAVCLHLCCCTTVDSECSHGPHDVSNMCVLS